MEAKSRRLHSRRQVRHVSSHSKGSVQPGRTSVREDRKHIIMLFNSGRGPQLGSENDKKGAVQRLHPAQREQWLVSLRFFKIIMLQADLELGTRAPYGVSR